ncbi:MAG TPA: CHAP domain-containing protein [Ktedonobacterales bacterium]
MRENGDFYYEHDADDQDGASIPSAHPRSLSSRTASTLRTATPAHLTNDGDVDGRTSTARRRRVSGPHATGPHLRALTPHHTTGQQHAARTPHRNATTARPVRSQDTALVDYTTRMLEAITVVEPVTLEEVTREHKELALYNAPTEHMEVTVVPGTTGKTPALLPVAPRVSKPRVRNSLIVWMLVLVTVASVLAAVQPLSHNTALAYLRAPFDAARPGPTGLWATFAETHNALGIGGGAGPGVHAPGSAGQPAKPTGTSQQAPSASPGGSGVLPAPVSPWPPANPYMFVPGHPAFAMQDVNNYYYWAFGQCTWWAQYKRQDENLTRMGNAQFWASGAAARGYHVGTVPRAGATVVFQPGVQGAGGAGHVAHVEAVYPGGWFLISEMNFYWNGGGWGRVDYRYAHSGGGVQFIY